jgi:hypothetical protein
MAVPLIPVVVLGAKIVARFAASKAGKEAAKKFAKEFGGTVKEKAKNLKSVQRAPTGSQATRMAKQKLKKDGIKPAQKDRLGPASSPKKAPKRDVRGDKVQKGIAFVGLTTAGFAPGTGPKKDRKATGTYERTAGIPVGGKPPKGKKEDRAKDSAVSPKPTKEGAASKRMPKKEPKKVDFRDFKTVAAAQKAGSDFFQGRDGKKKIAVTKEQLEKYKNKNKIKTNAEALRSYANMLRKR